MFTLYRSIARARQQCQHGYAATAIMEARRREAGVHMSRQHMYASRVNGNAVVCQKSARIRGGAKMNGQEERHGTPYHTLPRRSTTTVKSRVHVRYVVQRAFCRVTKRARRMMRRGRYKRYARRCCYTRRGKERYTTLVLTRIRMPRHNASHHKRRTSNSTAECYVSEDTRTSCVDSTTHAASRVISSPGTQTEAGYVVIRRIEAADSIC